MKSISLTVKYATISALLFLSVFATVSAQTDKGYTLLVPLPVPGLDSSKATLSSYLPAAFNLAVGLAVAMAFVMITLGGITYATTDSVFKKQDGKKFIEDAIWGLLIVIGAWVILNTINPQILSFKLDIKPPPSTTGGATVTGATAGATSLLPTTITALNDLDSKCGNCNISNLITSTTGGPHDVNSLHYQGRAVDLSSSNSALNAYIKTGVVGSSNGCTTYTQTLGGQVATFLWEQKGQTCGGTVASDGDHWHLSI